jgi:AraC-like DNA-binding protein
VRAPSQRLIDAQFTRNPALAGAELRLVNAQREWGFFSQDYQILFSQDWSGKVWYQRQEFSFDPRTVVVAAPNQLILAKKSTPGNLFCLTIDKALSGRLLESAIPGILTTGHHVVSEAKSALLAEFVRELLQSRCPLALEALLLELTAALVLPSAKAHHATEAIAKPSHPFDDQNEIAFDLRSLSEQLGTSRFSALRAFKRHFGLPPHNYQIHLRVERAQNGLRSGLSPARVAVDCGFFDQSHLTRHFKRVLGTTPAQYARAWLPASEVVAAPAGLAQAHPQ